MGRINSTRVLAGGFTAGILVAAAEAVLNGLILREEWNAVMRGFGKSPEMTAAQAVGYNAWAILLGLSAVWLYAAIRPRFGPGPRTALRAAFAVWFVGYALSSASALISGMLPARLLLTATAWGLVEMIFATLAGCWLYREDSAA